MPVVSDEKTMSLQGVCTIDDTEPLLQWLLAHPEGKVEMEDCVNLHSAILLTLMEGRAECVSWPADANLRAWLEAALGHCGISLADP